MLHFKVERAKDKKELLHHLHEADTHALADDIHNTAKERLRKEAATIDPEYESGVKNFLKKILTVAKYCAVWFVGSIAGVAVAQHFSRKFEYRADAFSAQTVGDPKPMINALEKFNKYFRQAWAEGKELGDPMQYFRRHYNNSTLFGKIMNIREDFYEFLIKTFPSHPPTSKRIEALRAIQI